MHDAETVPTKSKAVFPTGDAGCAECIEAINRDGWAVGYASYCHSCEHGVQVKDGFRIKAER